MICGTPVRNDIVRGDCVGDAKIVWTEEREDGEQIELSWYRLCLNIKENLFMDTDFVNPVGHQSTNWIVRLVLVIAITALTSL